MCRSRTRVINNLSRFWCPPKVKIATSDLDFRSRRFETLFVSRDRGIFSRWTQRVLNSKYYSRSPDESWERRNGNVGNTEFRDFAEVTRGSSHVRAKRNIILSERDLRTIIEKVQKYAVLVFIDIMLFSNRRRTNSYGRWRANEMNRKRFLIFNCAGKYFNCSGIIYCLTYSRV